MLFRSVGIVHGHSAHVVHGVEVREGRPILYDTGDFVDDYAVDETLRNDRGFLFELRVERDGTPAELRLLPTEIRECAVHTASNGAADWIHERMRERSEPFGTRFEQRDNELVVSLADDTTTESER